MEAISKGSHVPDVDIVSFAFDKQLPYDESEPLYIDAEESSRSLNYHETRSLVRRLIAGLQAAGLSPGGCVLVHLGNDVSERCPR
jgi:non-ribosomal peptide synthetase component E (peptide arylation enzyme)